MDVNKYQQLESVFILLKNTEHSYWLMLHHVMKLYPYVVSK